MAKQKEKSSFDAATVANKEPVQDQFRVPSLVTSDSPKLFESSAKFAKRKRMPIEDSRTSQLLPHIEPIATTTGGAPQSRPTIGCTESPFRRHKREDADSFLESHVRSTQEGEKHLWLSGLTLLLVAEDGAIRLEKLGCQEYLKSKNAWKLLIIRKQDVAHPKSYQLQNLLDNRTITNMRGASLSHGKRKTHSGVDSRGFQMESPFALHNLHNLHNQRPPQGLSDQLSVTPDYVPVLFITKLCVGSLDIPSLLTLKVFMSFMFSAPQVLVFQLNTNGKVPRYVDERHVSVQKLMARHSSTEAMAIAEIITQWLLGLRRRQADYWLTIGYLFDSKEKHIMQMRP
nr:hypothetical protein [Tanacetum cinerariifolium]